MALTRQGTDTDAGEGSSSSATQGVTSPENSATVSTNQIPAAEGIPTLSEGAQLVSESMRGWWYVRGYLYLGSEEIALYQILMCHYNNGIHVSSMFSLLLLMKV